MIHIHIREIYESYCKCGVVKWLCKVWDVSVNIQSKSIHLQEEWVWWSSATVFIIPTVIILMIWLTILHHFCKDNVFKEDKKFSSGRKW